MAAFKIVDKFNEITQTVWFQTKKHSPELLLVAGTVSVVGGTILACRATLKVDKVLSETKETIDTIHEVSESKHELYSKKDAREDLAKTYTRCAWGLFKIYGPAIGLETAGILAYFGAFGIMKKRVGALTSLLTATTGTLNSYRQRVAEKFGEETEKALFYNTKAEKIEKTVIDEKTGKEKTVKETVGVSELDEYGPYAFYFDEETSRACEKVPEYVDFFIDSEESYLSNILRVGRLEKKPVTYGDVISRFYIDLNSLTEFQKEAYLVAGWIFDANDVNRDNRVILERYHTYRRLEDGRIIPTTIVNPHVDGYIYGQIGNKEVKHA